MYRRFPPLDIASISLLSALFALVLAGCKPKAPTAESAADSSKSLLIGPESYSVASEGVVQTGPMISGALKPREQATVRAQVSGAVLRAYVDQGQRVGRGQTLATIDDRSIRDNVASAQAALVNARNQLELAKRDEDRQKAMVDIGAVPQRDVDNAQRGVASTRAAIAQAQAGVVAARKQLTYTRVAAPFSGVVSEQLANTGDIVQPGSPLYTIVDPSSMELEGTIPAEDLDSIRVGDQVEFAVNGYPGRTFTGSITRINPVADQVTRQVRIYVEVPNEGGTLVGQLFAEGRVITASRKTLTIPRRAIDKRGMRPKVALVRDGVVKHVEVSLGLDDDRTGLVEVLSGVRSGDTVLTGVALQITEGTNVQLTSAAGEKSASDLDRGGARR